MVRWGQIRCLVDVLLTDDRDKRIFSTGCAGRPSNTGSQKVPQLNGDATEENTALNDCFYEKKDWRACKDEVGCFADAAPRAFWLWACSSACLYSTDKQITDIEQLQMESFKQCWKRQGNNDRTDAKDA